MIVEVGRPGALDEILVAAHSQDADYRPVTSYPYESIQFLHILGAYPPDTA